jgi:hypothetical protein
MAGLVPAIHESDEPIVKVIPAWISREDQTHFPPSRPVFRVLLALDRRADETLGHTFPVFPDALDKIARDTRVQGAVRPIGHDVDPSRFHSTTLREVGYDSVDGRHKAGHDDKFGSIGAYV